MGMRESVSWYPTRWNLKAQRFLMKTNPYALIQERDIHSFCIQSGGLSDDDIDELCEIMIRFTD